MYCFDLTQIIIALIGTISATSFLSIKIAKKFSVNQKGNTVTNGDIVGRDKVGGDNIGGDKKTN